MRIPRGRKTAARPEAERRRYPRKPLEDQALIVIMTGESDVMERARVQDISREGVCFTKVTALKGFERDTDRIGAQQQVVAYLEDHPLTLFGTVVRMDAERLALTVRHSSNADMWKTLCD